MSTEQDREAFLRSICEPPDEDTPRLVYADWLQEHGEHDRAEFIRVQVEAAAADRLGFMWQKSSTRRAPMLFRDLHKIQPWNHPVISATLREHPGYAQLSSNTSAILWRRGFVEGLVISGQMLTEYRGAFKNEPVREVHVTSFAGECFPLAAQSVRGAFRWLEEQLFEWFPALVFGGHSSMRISKKKAQFLIASYPVSDIRDMVANRRGESLAAGVG